MQTRHTELGIVYALGLMLCVVACKPSQDSTPGPPGDDSTGPTQDTGSTADSGATPPRAEPRTRERFTTSWSVLQGEPKGEPWSIHFDASDWTSTTLPHNPSLIAGQPDAARTCWPDFSYEGETWYRREFSVPSEYAGLQLSLEFEAANTNATVWINGDRALEHSGGYLPFVVDLDEHVAAGSTDNVIVVRVDNTDDASVPPGNESWFNWGGLYREVWLTATRDVHISHAATADIPAGGGVSVWTSALDEAGATLQANTHVVNESETDQELRLESALLDRAGKTLTVSESALTLAAGTSQTIRHTLLVSDPQVWHPDDPILHTLRTRIYDGDDVVDQIDTRVGIRRIDFSHDAGFSINGEVFWLRGANRMQDYPHIGYAAPDALQANDARVLKEAGFDYVRTSQYPQDPAFLDACDELGLFVMAPIPGFQFIGDADFVARSQEDMRQLIRRDRNRPSVIAWELSLNETEFESDFAVEAAAIGHEECPHDQCFIAGWTHDWAYDIFIATPTAGARAYTGTKPFIVSEYGHWEYGGLDSITDVIRGDGDWLMADQAWHHMEGHHLNQATEYASGDGLWAGIDLACYPSGVVDTYRLPKFSAEFFAAQRAPAHEPRVFIASHWTKDSNPVVTVFGNCDRVEMYHNGVWVETQAPFSGHPTAGINHPPFYFVDVPAVLGELRAACLVDGAEVAAHTVTSPGSPEHLTMSATFTELRADGSDLSFVYAQIVDEDDVLVPSATSSVRFSVEGGTLASPERVEAEAGVAAAIVRAGETPGTLRVFATSDTLGEAMLEVELVEVDDLYEH